MEVQKIQVTTPKLSNLIDEIRNGTLRIPRFQRRFVWEKRKIIDLLDSIYKEYPIGSFFIWEADQKYNMFYKDFPELNLPKPDNSSILKYILDGQQRATALYVVINGLVINGTDYSQICFDLDKGEFFDNENKK